MKVDLRAVTLAFCLAASPALAQQLVTPSHGSGPNLVRPCTALSSGSDCSIGLPSTPSGSLGNSLMGPNNTLMNQTGSGLGSTFRPPSGAGTLSTSGPTDPLSRGISGGMAGSGTSDPLGIDSNQVMRSMSGGSLGRSLGGSFGERSAAGPLGGGGHSLGHMR
jgi:hypothetical protein